MGDSSRKISNKFWKKFDYKKAARVLKHAGFINHDLRKPLTEYRKQQIRNLYKENNGGLYRMASFREETKNRNRMEKLAGIPKGKKLSDIYVTEKIHTVLTENPNNLSKRQLAELNRLYELNEKSILKNPNNYGLRNYEYKKFEQYELEILQSHGWNIFKDHAILPIHESKNENYLSHLWYYVFPNGTKVVSLVQKNKKIAGMKRYTYFLLITSELILEVIENLIDSGCTDLTPDLIYTSPSTARINLNAKKVDDLSAFLDYVNLQATDKKTKKVDANLLDSLVESLRIESNKKPTERYYPLDKGF